MYEVLFEVEHLKKYFGSIKAVDDVSFKVEKGETLGLVGESGCGKSTLGRTILKLIEPTEGKLYITTSLKDGDTPEKFDITGGKRLRELRRKMQIIYQDPTSSLDPKMIIKDIVSEPLKTHKIAQGDKLSVIVAGLLRQVGLEEEHIWRYPYELSGGQRQRIAIARTIALKPEFIVLDEPTSALDVSVQAKILKLLKNLQRELNLTYLFITHDMSVIDYMCDRVGVMYCGKIVEISKKEQLLNEPKHPYTRALLSSIPSMNPSKRKMSMATILEGEVASPINPPKGCRFHPRCTYALKECGWEPEDLIAYFNKNKGEWVNLNVISKKGLCLEIKPTEIKNINRISRAFSDLVAQGKKNKEPLFEAIKDIIIRDGRIFVFFMEMIEPELLEIKHKGHFVACNLYPSSNNNARESGMTGN